MEKKEFEMTEEELQAIYDISRNQMPVLKIGSVWTGMDSQEKANSLWKFMAKKYGFIWDTARPSGKGPRFFLAEPSPIGNINS